MNATTATPSEHLDRAWAPMDVARYLGVSVRQLSDQRREDATFPTPRMVGRCPRWAPDAIRAWVALASEPQVLPPRRRGSAVRRVH